MTEPDINANYALAIDRFAIGYNKSVVLNSVTSHSLEILDAAMAQVGSGLETIVSAFEELRATSESTAENTRRIDGTMDAVLRKSEAMDVEIERRMEEIRVASDNAKSLAKLFVELGDKTKSISGMTGSIKDVSDKTGILAINASIEAARAGSVGRGFRIIANEVRSLAVQTGDFARNIEKNVGEFQSAVDTINGQMKDFTELFTRFMESFRGILVSFADNAKNLNEAGESLAGITSSIREEAEALNEGLSSLERVNDSMHETRVVLEVIQRSHESLDHLLDGGQK